MVAARGPPIVRLKGEPALHLILEVKGFDPLKEIKAQAAHRWVAAVNADKAHGTWQYAVTGKLSDVRQVLNDVGP